MKLSRKIAVAALAALAATAGVAGGAMLSPGALGAGRPAQIRPPKPTVPSPGPAYLGPAATLRWSVPERYAKGWDAWLTNDATYSRAYVSPDAWSVTVDGCGSHGGSDSITRYEVEITGVGFPFKTTWGGSSCRRRFDDLPRLAQYDVALTVRTKRDSDRTVERITLRDWLIVSLGDSMASGEGSPDQTGRYELLNKVTSDADVLRFLLLLSLDHPRPASDPDFKVRELRPVRWPDKRCHRSARAGHARVGAEIERRDPHSSVTFLSLASPAPVRKSSISSTPATPASSPPPIRSLQRFRPRSPSCAASFPIAAWTPSYCRSGSTTSTSRASSRPARPTRRYLTTVTTPASTTPGWTAS
jgi:hypothetical protein